MANIGKIQKVEVVTPVVVPAPKPKPVDKPIPVTNWPSKKPVTTPVKK